MIGSDFNGIAAGDLVTGSDFNIVTISDVVIGSDFNEVTNGDVGFVEADANGPNISSLEGSSSSPTM